MMECAACNVAAAVVRRSYSGLPYCRKCFIDAFEEEIYQTIERHRLIVDGDVVCIGVSGGKDSSVLAHVLATLKERYSRKWTLHLLAADEGITGYRDYSLNVVLNMKNRNYDGLKILNFKEKFGFTMDEVVALIGKKNNCTVCGTFRRQILEIGARLLGANKLCTGHNIDDNAETVLLNICRNDLFKLAKNVEEITGALNKTPEQQDAKGTETRITGTSVRNSRIQKNAGKQADTDINVGQEIDSSQMLNINATNEGTKGLKRIKPMMDCFEKEIVMYARYQKLEYFSTECIYAPEAYRGYMRTFIKQLEAIDPKIIKQITKSSDYFYAEYANNGRVKECRNCGIEGINDICKACVTVEKLSSLRIDAEIGVKTTPNSIKEKATIKWH